MANNSNQYAPGRVWLRTWLQWDSRDGYAEYPGRGERRPYIDVGIKADIAGAGPVEVFNRFYKVDGYAAETWQQSAELVPASSDDARALRELEPGAYEQAAGIIRRAALSWVDREDALGGWPDIIPAG